MIDWQTHAVSIEVKDEPLPGHQAPLDRRHRWSFVTHGKRGYWYRCRVCRRRAVVTPIGNLIAKKMQDAERALDDGLNEMIWR